MRNSKSYYISQRDGDQWLRYVYVEGFLWGKYPFGDAPTRLTPAIDMTWRMYLKCVDGQPGKYTIQIFGEHDNFPAYEVWINDQLGHEWYPTDRGPGPGNLNNFREYHTPKYEVSKDGTSKIE